MTVDHLASSVWSLSRPCCFSLRFFIISLRWPRPLRGGGHRFHFGQVDGDARTHGRGQCDLLNVLALGRARLGFHHGLDYRVAVLSHLPSFTLILSNPPLHPPRLLHTHF